MKVAQYMDVDGITININTDENRQQLESSVIFGQEVELFNISTLDGSVVSLVFREIKNKSNRLAVCTGFKFGDKFYLDRPDDGDFVDAFDNMKVKEIYNNEIREKQAPTPPEEHVPDIEEDNR